MPAVMPISEVQRNIGAVSARCRETQAPVYLTKNGTATLVIMDAEAFDRKYAAVDELAAHEERISRSIARGYDDLVNGNVRPWSRAKADADRIRASRDVL